jgi:hypothetical protein
VVFLIVVAGVERTTRNSPVASLSVPATIHECGVVGSRWRYEAVKNANQYRKARAVLQALIEGCDPATGDELPKDAIVNRIEINRSMIIALAAIEQVQARSLRRALLPESVGKAWSEEEELRLKSEFARSEPTDIAAKHKRTIRSIETRLERLGLLRSDQRTTSNSFTGEPHGRAE